MGALSSFVEREQGLQRANCATDLRLTLLAISGFIDICDICAQQKAIRNQPPKGVLGKSRHIRRHADDLSETP
jgi:hypothetical protein